MGLINDLCSNVGVQSQHSVFGILVVGETGSGKSTLIHNITGHNIADVPWTLKYGTQFVKIIGKYHAMFEGVHVILYDTCGHVNCGQHIHHLQMMKDMFKGEDIHMTTYCMKMSKTRL